MSHILEDPELMKLFKKKGWLRKCTVCGDFLGNTANWILHMKTHLHVEPAEVEPNTRKQQISFRQNRHDDEDRKIEMEEVAKLPDWLESKIRNRKTVNRFKNWWMEVKADHKESVLEDRNRSNSSMEVDPDEETALSEEESAILPEYRSWSTSSYDAASRKK